MISRRRWCRCWSRRCCCICSWRRCCRSGSGSALWTVNSTISRWHGWGAHLHGATQAIATPRSKSYAWWTCNGSAALRATGYSSAAISRHWRKANPIDAQSRLWWSTIVFYHDVFWSTACFYRQIVLGCVSSWQANSKLHTCFRVISRTSFMVISRTRTPAEEKYKKRTCQSSEHLPFVNNVAIC